jgi:hypothetical protein
MVTVGRQDQAAQDRLVTLGSFKGTDWEGYVMRYMLIATMTDNTTQEHDCTGLAQGEINRIIRHIRNAYSVRGIVFDYVRG